MGKSPPKAFSDGVLWANLHLLFWLSLLPFATGWVGENHFTALPASLYGVGLLRAALGYWWLQQRITAMQGSGLLLRRAIGSVCKGRLSPVFYAIAMPAASWSTAVSPALYVVVALLWLVPDRRIERVPAD